MTKYTCYKCNRTIGPDQSSRLVKLPIGKVRMHDKHAAIEGIAPKTSGCDWWYKADPDAPPHPEIPQTEPDVVWHKRELKVFRGPLGGMIRLEPIPFPESRHH